MEVFQVQRLYLVPQVCCLRPFPSTLDSACQRTYEISSVDGSETNIVLLYDAGVQTVEIHDKYKFVVQSFEWFENQTAFIFVLFLASCCDDIAILIFVLVFMGSRQFRFAV